MLCRKRRRLTRGIAAQIAVIATRYLAVFPLASIINFVHRARGQRHDELPHSYQMMLFWAGLRGAVGVALSNGFQGENAAALRTTVLVVVVLTVIMFGGTTARMLEVMGIKVGVEEEGSSGDDENMLIGRRHEREWLARSTSGPWTGRADLYGYVPYDITSMIGEIMTLPSYSDGIGETMAISEAVAHLCGKGAPRFQQDLKKIRTPMGAKYFLCPRLSLLRARNQAVTLVPVVHPLNERQAVPQSPASREPTGLSRLLMNDTFYHCFLTASPHVHRTLAKLAEEQLWALNLTV